MKTKRNLIGQHIPLMALNDLEKECIERIMDDYSEQETELLIEAVELIKYFVNRVEAGTIRSVRTYDKFKNFLKKVDKYEKETDGPGQGTETSKN